MKQIIRRELQPLSLAAYVTIAMIAWEVSLQRSAESISQWLPLFVGFAAGFAICDLERRGRKALWLMLAQAALALGLIAQFPQSTAAVLLVIVAAQLPAVLSLRGSVALLIVADLVMAAIFYGEGGWRDALLGTCIYGGFQAFALFTMHIAKQAEAARDEAAVVNAQLMATRELLGQSAREGERLRLSRELHDVAGHSLTALKLTLRGMEGRVQDDAAEDLHQARELTHELLQSIRAVVASMRQADGVDLAPALQTLIAPFERPHFKLHIDAGLMIDDGAIAHDVLRCAQEAVTNVVRHAQASEAKLSLQAKDGQLRLEVSDNGRGLGHSEPGSGLSGLRERVASHDGTMTLDSDSQGTRLRCSWRLT